MLFQTGNPWFAKILFSLGLPTGSSSDLISGVTHKAAQMSMHPCLPFLPSGSETPIRTIDTTTCMKMKHSKTIRLNGKYQIQCTLMDRKRGQKNNHTPNTPTHHRLSLPLPSFGVCQRLSHAPFTFCMHRSKPPWVLRANVPRYNRRSSHVPPPSK